MYPQLDGLEDNLEEFTCWQLCQQSCLSYLSVLFLRWLKDSFTFLCACKCCLKGELHQFYTSKSVCEKKLYKAFCKSGSSCAKSDKLTQVMSLESASADHRFKNICASGWRLEATLAVTSITHPDLYSHVNQVKLHPRWCGCQGSTRKKNAWNKKDAISLSAASVLILLTLKSIVSLTKL